MDEISTQTPAPPDPPAAPAIYRPQYQCRLCADPTSFLFQSLLETHLRAVHGVYQLSPDVMEAHMPSEPHEEHPQGGPPGHDPDKDHPTHPHGGPPGQDKPEEEHPAHLPADPEEEEDEDEHQPAG